jgi:hypothetical protein
MSQINNPRRKQNRHVTEEVEAASAKKCKEEAKQALYITRI